MKKFLITSLALPLLIIIFLFGCTKNMKMIELKDPAMLSEDKAFIEFAIETHDYLLFMTNAVKKQSTSLSDLQLQLNTLQSKRLSFGEQMQAIDKIFQSPISNRLNAHMEAYKSSWASIKSRYSVITSEVLEKECAEVLANKFLKENLTQTLHHLKL